MASAFGSFDPNRLDTSDLSTKVKADGFLTKPNGFDKVDNTWDSISKFASDSFDGVSDFVSDTATSAVDFASDTWDSATSAFGETAITALDSTKAMSDKGKEPEGTSSQEHVNSVMDKKNEILMYPESLGISSGEMDFSYNSNTDYEGWGLDTGADPYIHFCFKRITVTDKDIQDMPRTATSHLAEATGSMVGAEAMKNWKTPAPSGGGGKLGMASSLANLGKGALELGLVANAAKAMYQGVKTLAANATLDANPNRETYAHIALYMPPTVTIQDGANYEATSRAALAAAGAITGADRKKGGVDKTNAAADATVSMNAMLGMGLTGGGLVAGAMSKVNPGGMAGLAGMGQVINLVGQESNRILGRAMNPNEYMQFKSTQLRTFTLNFKFLPMSANESDHANKIIRQFRAAMYPHRNSGITLTVPDIVGITFKNVGGMVKMPEVYITNINVTYNPNTASFFKSGGHPVEIDIGVELQEIHPIHKEDVVLHGR